MEDVSFKLDIKNGNAGEIHLVEDHAIQSVGQKKRISKEEKGCDVYDLLPRPQDNFLRFEIQQTLDWEVQR